MGGRFEEVFKTSWKTKKCYAEDVLKTSSRRLEDQQMFAGYIYDQRLSSQTVMT